MDYDLVTLKDKLVVGITDRTNNTAPDVGEKISLLWQRFYMEMVAEQIHHRINDIALGIYTDYASDEKGDYTVMIAYEVNASYKEEAVSKEHTSVVAKVINGGRYAKFTIQGERDNIFEKVADTWQLIWQMDLPRLFGSDFEAYQYDITGTCEVNIYISLKE